jgi:hypothetical protein
VKVTGVEGQTGLEEAAIDTLTGRMGLTIIATAFETAGLSCVHEKLEVSLHVTRSPFAGE